MSEKLPEYRRRRWVSISSLINFSRCPKKAFWTSGLGLGEEGIKNWFLFGEALHSALPYAISGDLAKADHEFSIIWKEEIADKKRNLAHAHSLLANIHHKHSMGRGGYELLDPPSEFQMIDLDHPVSPWEVAFAIDIGMPVPLVGRIDALIKLPFEGGDICPLDFKTDSLFITTPEKVGECFWISPQLIGYSIVIDMLMREEVLPNSFAAVEIFPVKTGYHESHLQVHSISQEKKEAFLTWARWQTMQFLSMEKSYMKSKNHTDFIMNIGNCEGKFSHGANTFPCDYKTLCNLSDPTLGLPLYQVNPEVEFTLAKEPVNAK